MKNNFQYTEKTFTVDGKDISLWVFFKEDRIVIPKKLQTRVITWYHDTLFHPGETRTEATIAQHFYWKGLRTQASRESLLAVFQLSGDQKDTLIWSISF